ncbi:MAG: hypothetical protein ACYCWW_13435 [Deltaproteobacteria bacterium]
MKRLLAAAALSVGLSCGSKVEPPAAATPPTAKPMPDALPTTAEREPNDAPAQAQVISTSVEVTADLHPVQPASRPDEDWYVVRATAPTNLRAELLPPPAAHFSLEVYDRDLNRLLSLTCGTATSGPTCLLPSERVSGQAYLRVFSPTSATGSYRLDLRLSAPDPDAESEPNDRAVDATPLPLDHPLHGTLATPTDEDWYRVELATPPATVPVAPCRRGLRRRRLPPLDR